MKIITLPQFARNKGFSDVRAHKYRTENRLSPAPFQDPKSATPTWWMIAENAKILEPKNKSK
jgi:hypothetical protein